MIKSGEGRPDGARVKNGLSPIGANRIPIYEYSNLLPNR